MTLKPCPFCGSTNVHLNPHAVERATLTGEKMWATRIVCVDCPAAMSVSDEDVTVDQVVAMWNRREP